MPNIICLSYLSFNSVENFLLVHCVAGDRGGGNVVDTLENMANFVVGNNGDYKDPPPHGGGLHNGPQRG